MSAVWTSLVAVVGTLAGGVLSAMVQGVLARANRREARRADALAAVAQLAAALANHRRAMWVLEDRRLTAAPAPAVDEAQTITHDTRAAIEIPLHTVSILVPALAQPAEEATRATFAMRNAVDSDVLETLRQAAKDAHGRFVAAAREVFADMGDFVAASRSTRNKAVAAGQAVAS
jgi:type II secretory pathway pseudopilin PulG